MITTGMFTISSIILGITLLQIHFASVSSAPPYITEDNYPTQPTEVLPIQPVQLYPQSRGYRISGRKLERENEIIYVKLLKPKRYRPKKYSTKDENLQKIHELKAKDIFYVKALANGQFSHHRVKWYRLPEFYAISVFRKGEKPAPKQ